MSARKQAIETLLQFLNHDNPVHRCSAAQALGTMKAKASVSALTDRLMDENEDVCLDIIFALGSIADETSIPALWESYLHHSTSEMKSSIVEVFGQMGKPEIAEYLTQVLRKPVEKHYWESGDNWDDRWDIQIKAVEVLGKLGIPEYAVNVIELLEQEEAPDLMITGYQCLARMGRAGMDYLLTKIQNGTPLQGMRAISAMVHSGCHIQNQTLIDCLQKDDAKVQMEAIKAMIASQNDGYFAPLKKCLTASNDEVRELAVKALETLGEKQNSQVVLAEIFPLIEDAEDKVQIQVIDAFSKRISAAESMTNEVELISAYLQKLKLKLSRSSEEVALASISALGKWQSEETKILLKEMVSLKNRSEHFRSEAIRRLAKMMTPLDFPFLMSHLNDASSRVRLECLQGLASFEDESIQNLLVEMAYNKHLSNGIVHYPLDVRCLAIELMNRFEGDAFTEVLLDLMREDLVEIQLCAINALGKRQDSSVIDRMRNALHSEEKAIRAASATALSRLNAIEAIPDLLELVPDDDSEVLITVISALIVLIDTERDEATRSQLQAVILDCLKHPECKVRQASAELLSLISGLEMVPVLIEYALQNCGDQCRKTGKLLREYASEEATYQLCAILADSNQEKHFLTAITLLEEIYREIPEFD